MYFTMGKTVYFLNVETKEAYKAYTGPTKRDAKEMCELQNRLHNRVMRERAQMSEGERKDEEDFNRDMVSLFTSMRHD